MTAATKPIAPRRKTQIEITYESVTPARANLWLKQTRVVSEDPSIDWQQRRPSPGVIKKYTAEMGHDMWHRGTADTIRLGESSGMEVCIDGQQRLNAIANSGMAQDMFVARNVPLCAFKYIDQGNSRTLKDVMDCAGWDATSTLSSAGRYLWVYSLTGTPFGTVRDDDRLAAGNLFDWLEEYEPYLPDVWERDGALVRAARKGIKMSEAIMLFLWIHMARSNPTEAQKVFMYLSNPMDRSIEEPSLGFQFAVKAIYDLQEEMRSLKDKGMKTRSDEHRDPCTSALIFAWNCMLEGREFRTLKGFKDALTKAENTKLWAIK